MIALLLDFCEIPMPLAFIFIILDFKDSLFFYLLQSNFHLSNFQKGVFLWGNIDCGYFQERESSRCNLRENISQENVSLNCSNHSTTVQIFQLSQNTFNIISKTFQLSTNHSTSYKAFKVSQIVYKSFNVVEIHSIS